MAWLIQFRETEREREGEMSDWIEMKKAFIRYEDDATLAVIPVPPRLTGYFATVIRHRGGGTAPAPVDYELMLADAMKRAEELYQTGNH